MTATGSDETNSQKWLLVEFERNIVNACSEMAKNIDQGRRGRNVALGWTATFSRGVSSQRSRLFCSAPAGQQLKKVRSWASFWRRIMTNTKNRRQKETSEVLLGAAAAAARHHHHEDHLRPQNGRKRSSTDFNYFCTALSALAALACLLTYSTREQLLLKVSVATSSSSNNHEKNGNYASSSISYNASKSPFMTTTAKKAKKKSVAATTTTTMATTRKDKFLKYGTTSGWSNQLMSLKHGFWLAYASNRTLVLPPIMEHFETIQWTYFDQTVDEVYHNGSKDGDGYPPSKIRMSKTINFASFPNSRVSVMDYRDYYDRILAPKLERTEKEWKDIQLTLQEKPKNGKYRCTNTIWTMDASLHGQSTTSACEGHLQWYRKDDPPYNVTRKHAPRELQQYDDYDVLTFNFIFPWSLFDDGSFRSVAPFEVVYTEPIRLAARNIYSRWNSGKLGDGRGGSSYHHTDALDRIVRVPENNYFSIHVRGTEFGSDADWGVVISNMLEEAQNAIVSDFYDRYGAIAPDTSATSSIATRNMTAFITYTVLLVTDVGQLVNMGKDDSVEGRLPNMWRQSWKRIAKKIKANSVSFPLSLLLGENADDDGKAADVAVNVRAKIQLRTAANFKKDEGPLEERLGNNPYASIYLDQQLAACARLGFAGSHLNMSTFQQLIKSMHDKPLVC